MEPWLGVKSAGTNPVTFDLGSYDVTTDPYLMISARFNGHTWGEAQTLLEDPQVIMLCDSLL